MLQFRICGLVERCQRGAAGFARLPLSVAVHPPTNSHRRRQHYGTSDCCSGPPTQSNLNIASANFHPQSPCWEFCPSTLTCRSHSSQAVSIRSRLTGHPRSADDPMHAMPNLRVPYQPALSDVYSQTDQHQHATASDTTPDAIT